MIDLNVLQMHGARPSKVFVYEFSQTDTVVIPAIGGYRINVWAYEFSSSAKAWFQFKGENPDLDLYPDEPHRLIGCQKWFGGGGGAIGDMTPYRLQPNESLLITTNCEGDHSVALWYTLS